ncbi:hypothetical protein WEI85_03540 [Actinomycetes bacterium KLBMP 9797]
MTRREFSEVDIDLLADYVGGVLDGTPEHATVTRLVADDPAWARAHADLSTATATVHSQLADWGATAEPMPVEVADRVAAALSDAVRSHAARSDVALSGAARSGDETRPTLTVIPGERPATRTPRRARGWRSWAGPAVAAAGVLVAAGLGISLINTEDAHETSAGSSNADAPTSARDETRADAPQVMQDATQQLIASGHDYQGATLANEAVPAPADKAGAFSAQEATELPVPAVLRRLVAGDALGACLNAIAAAHDRGTATVQTVDFATFETEPAVVVFFADENGERWIWASGPDCGLTGPDTRANARIP